jgi:hypothetical protein
MPVADRHDRIRARLPSILARVRAMKYVQERTDALRVVSTMLQGSMPTEGQMNSTRLQRTAAATGRSNGQPATS